ncbi:putative ABC transporter permease [Bariatricus sp. SGI.154]|uniref:putative ABC transporter permease n=1 Tax=Bariatricus sp. SGI.154 TaxID=3420549 RepID=UPI003D061902
MQLYFFVLYFFTYGFLGWCTEVAYATTKELRFVNRGFLNGPICPIYGVGVGVVVMFLEPVENNLILLYIVSTVLVTLIEGLTGYLMDKIFHHKWWDYSNQPLNIGGYVCLLFSLVWGVACVAIVKVIHPMIHNALALIPLTAGIVLIVVLGTVLFADLYVTASAILKLNKRLDAMEKIAAELREISDKVGENIHENVMETMEFSEEKKKQLDSAVLDLREKLDETKQQMDSLAVEMREKLENATEEQKSRFEERKNYIEEQRNRIEERIRMEEQKVRMEEQKVRMEEQKVRIAELKNRYAELAERSTRVSRRLAKAFPKMESRHHKEIMEELKLRLKRDRR